MAIALVAIVSSPGVGAADQSTGSSCPALPLEERDARLVAGFASNSKTVRTLPYGRRSMLTGRLVNPAGLGLSGESICIEARPRVPGWPYSMVGSATTNAKGDWFFKLPSGPSQSIRVNYGGDPELISAFLNLGVHAHATLHLRQHRTRPHHRIYFSGHIPGPLPAKRVVILRGTAPGAKRKHLIRRGRTDAFGHFRIGYAFSPAMAPAKFVFWVVVPVQDGYPYKLGHSSKRFVRLRR